MVRFHANALMAVCDLLALNVVADGLRDRLDPLR